jgi:hypothetical protein
MERLMSKVRITTHFLDGKITTKTVTGNGWQVVDGCLTVFNGPEVKTFTAAPYQWVAVQLVEEKTDGS